LSALGAVEEKRSGRLRLFKILDNSVSAFMLKVMEHADRWDADGIEEEAKGRLQRRSMWKRGRG